MRTGREILGTVWGRTLALSVGLILSLSWPAAAGATHDPEKRTLTAVFPEQFPPVFQVTGNHVPAGFGIEMMEEIAARGRLHIVYRSTRTWEDAFAALREGRADLIPNLGITPARQKDFDFSLPLMRMPVSLFVRVDSRNPPSLQGLVDNNRVIATVKGHVAVDLFRDQPRIRLALYDTIDEAFVALHTGKADALVYPDPIVEQLAQQLDLGRRLRKLAPPLAVVERAVAVRKGDAALLALLNKEIATLVDTPRYRTIYERWYGTPAPFWTTERVTYLVAGLLALMLVVSAYARFRLLKRVNAFNSAVLDTAVEGILTLDVHGTMRSANHAAERMFHRESDGLGGVALRTLLTESEATRLHRRLRELLQPNRGPECIAGIHRPAVRR